MRTWNYILPGLILWLTPAMVKAQKHGITVGAGYSLNTFQTENMNKLVNSFNDYYQVGLKKPFAGYDLGSMQGFNINIGYRYMKRETSGFSAYGGYMFGYSHNFNSVKIWNNTGYDMEMAFKCHDFLFEGGYQIKGKVFMHGFVGIGIRDIQVQMWKVYQDGSRSMGYEYDINGWYKTNSFSAQFGASLGFRVWHFFFPLRVGYEVPFFKDNTLQLTDFDVNRFRSHNLPNDYSLWLVSNISNDDNNRIPENDFMGLRIHFGVEFMIPLFKN
jgi:hypothetical protein